MLPLILLIIDFSFVMIAKYIVYYWTSSESEKYRNEFDALLLERSEWSKSNELRYSRLVARSVRYFFKRNTPKCDLKKTTIN